MHKIPIRLSIAMPQAMFTRNTNPSLSIGMRNLKMDSITKKFLMTPKIRQKGIGKGGAKRLRDQPKDAVKGITKLSIRKLARRGGVKRMSGLVYEETRCVIKLFLEKLIHDTIQYTESAQKKTVTAMDVVMALKKQGKYLYGFD